jgi:hypothetical protein
MSQIAKTLREVAQHFGKCERTAQRWARAGMPRIAGGRYDLGQVEDWLKSTKYLGASLREFEAEAQAKDLFEVAVLQLRHGLENLCRAFVVARGRTRARLIDRAIRDILHGTMKQESLL